MAEDQGHGFYLAKGITWRLDAAYAETPHLFGLLGRTPYSQVSPGVFVLPDSLQKFIQGKSNTVGNRDLLDLLANSPSTVGSKVTFMIEEPYRSLPKSCGRTKLQPA